MVRLLLRIVLIGAMILNRLQLPSKSLYDYLNVVPYHAPNSRVKSKEHYSACLELYVLDSSNDSKISA